MEELPKYLAGIVVLIITIYRAIKNQQKKSVAQPQTTATKPNTATSDLDTIFEMDRERNSYNQVQENVVLKSNPIKETKQTTRVNSDSFSYEEQEEELEHEDLLENFDARKAIIYSEILKPPYL
ncbi:MAG: hypothetical protein NWQ55_06165 [Salibacteraceae bacterium]|jgi:hypothetical protein|nr:hypothetical protein [Salibacteraceae bacterium]MDP4685709.1 hypothetical protein [Salibacteraceae bacterium]MDP4762300.1 hypothetical protein [Salibacteraceae bacterium]MDP4843385.1 hypothetical protein [Salibacteraceae bacterium]MDP4935332.1 hypothetical protein [Salibacteraceae bacterium]